VVSFAKWRPAKPGARVEMVAHPGRCEVAFGPVQSTWSPEELLELVDALRECALDADALRGEAGPA